jgi:uncharacterized membrane protein YhiD involved in acid resistance
MLGYQPGVGFYAAALLMAALCMLSMSLLHRLEVKLPGRATLDVSLIPSGPAARLTSDIACCATP